MLHVVRRKHCRKTALRIHVLRSKRIQVHTNIQLFSLRQREEANSGFVYLSVLRTPAVERYQHEETSFFAFSFFPDIKEFLWVPSGSFEHIAVAQEDYYHEDLTVDIRQNKMTSRSVACAENFTHNFVQEITSIIFVIMHLHYFISYE